jgi:hypothetical protein
MNEPFNVNERVSYLHRGSSRSKTYEVLATIIAIFPKSYLIKIDGLLNPRYVDKKLQKLKKLTC